MTPTYEIKGIKNFKGHEGEPCSQGNLYKGTKKVCEWSDDSSGGSMQVRFVSEAEKTAFVPFARDYLSSRLDVLDRPYDLSQMSDAHIAAEAVESMSYAAVEEVNMRKLCKNKIAFKVKPQREGAEPDILAINWLYTEQEVARLKAMRPDLLEIINARFGAPLKEDTPEHLAAEAEFYRKECAKKTLFIRNVEGVRTVFVISRPYSSVIGSQLRTKHNDIVRIVNEAFSPSPALR